MKTKLHFSRAQRGYILLVTMVFVGLGVLLLMTLMNWTSETSRLTDRNNEYYSSAAAAEAATEKILVHISRDYLNGGGGSVSGNLANYSTMIPTATEYSNWGNYIFINPSTGANGSVYVDQYQTSTYTVLDSQYQGLSGYQAIYRIIANAQLTNSHNGTLKAGVEQFVATEAIPLFQFAIFYNEDLEINPSPNMVVTGRVHSNGNIYADPANSLTFSNDVTASGTINLTFKPGDPSGSRVSGGGAPNVIFDGEHDGGVSSLNLPIGTNSTTTNVYQILQPPQATDSAAMTSQRMYNKADLLILVSNAGVTVKSGPFLGGIIKPVPPNQWTNFLATTNLIFNARENVYVQTCQLNIGNFNTWVTSPTNLLKSLLAAVDETFISKVYIADFRTGGSYEPGVYLKNGAQLPPAGLTIATPDPVYIKGDYNVTTNGTNFSLSVNNTAYTYPSAVMGDAITILSDAWVDASSTNALSSRVATTTTVNTALLVGIVPTGVYNGTSYYSGGVENFPRFLEDWSSATFWYNGSMVAMFDSQIATAPWGSNANTYSPPTRDWAFDQNFSNQNKLPPGTPLILTMERMNWAFQTPGVVPP